MEKQRKNQKIKVLHVGNSHSIFDSRVFQKECVSLARAGYSVSYLTSDKVASFIGEKDGVSLKTLSGAGNPYRVKQLIPYFRRKKEIKKKYLKAVLEEKPDIVHFHEEQLGFLAKKLKKSSVQVIYDIHENHAGTAGTYFEKYGMLVSRCMAFLVKRREHRIVKAADGIITAEDRIAELLMPVLKKKKWAVIHNYSILEDEIIRSDSETESAYICYTGDMSTSRKLETTFEALARLNKDIQILMIGNIAPEYRKKLENIYPNVKFCGYLDKEEIRRLHGGAFAGMCVLARTTHIYYSLPIKMFEYMRDGLPVIASDFPGWKTILEGNDCGLCVPHDDPDAVGRAIDYLYTHQKEGRKMGENGRKAALEKYNWKQEEEKLVSFYKNFV